MIKKTLATVFSLMLTALPALAADPDPEALKRAIKLHAPDLEVEAVYPTPLAGLYEVVSGAEVVYFSVDGRYVFQGKLFDLKEQRNLTEERQSTARQAVLKALSPERMIVFRPKETRHVITVFTDIDCPYCRKLHAEMDAYHAKGIEVRYLLFPRAGVKSPSYDKAVSVWCADDRNAALTAAKAGKEVPKKECDNPVKDHLALGEELGVTGTPSIITANGRMLPGYVPAERLAAALEQMAKP